MTWAGVVTSPLQLLTSGGHQGEGSLSVSGVRGTQSTSP